jgi:hypothetical protein
VWESIGHIEKVERSVGPRQESIHTDTNENRDRHRHPPEFW